MKSNAEHPGEIIGRYKLLAQIGEGGCGDVYLAEQLEPVRRRVALKIIKLGMDTKSVIARFEAERQALAMMDHPNIAKILDAGVVGENSEGRIRIEEGGSLPPAGVCPQPLKSGRPFFVMELVRGTKITQYCDEAKLHTRARLDLFIQVCQAIQHAHQKGIIHRDIKPSNILVTLNDPSAAAVPKVIDFGIAKATSGMRLTEKTIFTAFEQFIGTPAYMSPEQAVLSSLDIDTRSDIYALGVLLYELLTGKTPFETEELMAIGLDEMRRAIREQEPQRPSTRVSTLSENERSTTARHRGIDAPKLATELRGDLDWVVMKALEKDRARRYATATGLALDIQRYLNHEPVVARPPSRLYRLKKAVRRNQLAFTAAGTVVAALVIALGLSMRLFLQERAARTRALAAEMTERNLRQMAELRELNTRALQLRTQFIGAESPLAARQKVLEAQRRLLGEDHPEVADSLDELARIFVDIEKNLPEAEKAARGALAIRRRISPQGDLRVAQSLEKLSEVLKNPAEREQLVRESLRIRRRLQGNENVDTALSINDLGVALHQQRKLSEALPLYRESFAACRRLLPAGHSRLAVVAGNVIGNLIELGELSEAETAIREFVPANIKARPEFSRHVSVLADLVFKAGKFEDGEKLLDDLLAQTPDSVELRAVRARFLARGGRFSASVRDYRRLIELKSDHNSYWHELAAVLAFTQQKRELEEHSRRFLKRFVDSADVSAISRAAKSALIMPDASENTSIAIELSDGLDSKTFSPDGFILCNKGLANYRRGAFRAALDCLQEACEDHQPSSCQAQAFAIAAMARGQLKQTEQAQSDLARSKNLESYGLVKVRKGDPDRWDDWLRASVLIREASALIEGNAKSSANTK